MIIADRFGELPHDPLPEVEEIDFFENKEIVVGSPEVAQDKETAIFDPLLVSRVDDGVIGVRADVLGTIGDQIRRAAE